MNTQLAGLIIKRHWKFIVTFFVIVLGSYIFMANQQVEQWKEQEESFSTGWGRHNYDEMKKNPEDYSGTSYFTKTGFVSFEEYQKQNLEVFQNLNPETEPDSYYTRLVDPVLVMFFLTVSFGLFAFFYDYKTNFNPVIFSSKFSRRRFYWLKTTILTASFGGTVLFSKVIQIAMSKSQIPVEFYNASWAQLLPSLLGSTLFYLTMFLASMVIGLVLGELSTAIITVPILIFSLLIFLNSLDTVIGLFRSNPEVDVFRAPLSQNIAELSTISINPISWIIVLLLIFSVLFLLFSGNYLFNRISLENYGQFLLISKLRFPLLIFLVIYGTFTFSIQGIFFAPSLYSVYMNENSLLYFIQGTLILALLLTIAGYFLLYRDFKFKEIRKAFQKKSN